MGDMTSSADALFPGLIAGNDASFDSLFSGLIADAQFSVPFPPAPNPPLIPNDNWEVRTLRLPNEK